MVKETLSYSQKNCGDDFQFFGFHLHKPKIGDDWSNLTVRIFFKGVVQAPTIFSGAPESNDTVGVYLSNDSNQIMSPFQHSKKMATSKWLLKQPCRKWLHPYWKMPSSPGCRDATRFPPPRFTTHGQQAAARHQSRADGWVYMGC